MKIFFHEFVWSILGQTKYKLGGREGTDMASNREKAKKCFEVLNDWGDVFSQA